MTARMTEAEARALGIEPAPGRSGRRDRTVARGPYATACHDCHELFFTRASEDRHLATTGHARYELVLE